MFYRAFVACILPIALAGCFGAEATVEFEPRTKSMQTDNLEVGESGCLPDWEGDGWCDFANNRTECNWDGGDCCPSTCQEDADYACGIVGWDCNEPEACENTGECEPAPEYNSVDSWEEWCELYPEYCEMGQGEEGNNESDDWCEQFPEFCDENGNSINSPDCINSWIGDGWCDPENNSEGCGWDGGDCCPSTCVDSDFDCGDYGWACSDPAACENTGECEPAPENNSSWDDWDEWDNGGCIDSWIGDGWCDFDNNSEECSWDGGDCCPSTCPEDAPYTCGDFPWDCQEPEACENTGECESAPESDSGDTWEEWCEQFPEACETNDNGTDSDPAEDEQSDENNFPDEWCEQFPELCDDVDDCAQFPELCDADDGQNETVGSHCAENWIGDAWCDPVNNTQDCDWDGGDCCPSTCIDSEWTCGNFEFDCEDPGACENTGECSE